MSWLEWFHKVMGTDIEPPHEAVPDDREAIIKTKLEIRRTRREIEQLNDILTVVENRLQTQADVMGRRPSREER